LSPLTTSTGCNTWIASTDKGSVVEDQKQKRMTRTKTKKTKKDVQDEEPKKKKKR